MNEAHFLELLEKKFRPSTFLTKYDEGEITLEYKRKLTEMLHNVLPQNL